MGILDIFRKKETKKIESTALTKHGETVVKPFKANKKKIRTIVDFIENALNSNGGNYEDICQKLISISDFAKHAKEYGVKCNLGRVDEALKLFFTYQPDIKYYPLKNAPYTAFYTKKDGWNRYNYRGVTVLQDEKAGKPVLYFGRRNENAETHRDDSIFAFDDDLVILRDENKSNYDEIPLFGDGTYAEFLFDSNNHITSVRYKYMTHPRLGFWSDEQVCEFDSESGRYRLQPKQVPERIYNDPKPSDKSIKKCASFIVNMFSTQPDEDETGLGK